MIINYTVENHKSIKEQMLLNLTAAKRYKTDGTLGSEKYSMNILPVMGIYGANGSGKSNLVESLYCMKSYVVGNPVTVIPFKYESDERENSPTSYSMLFIADDGVMYHYGFSVQGLEIIEEWLSAYYTKRESVMFERTRESVAADEFEYHYGTKFIDHTKGGKVYLDVVAKGLSRNRLFVTELAEKHFNSVASTVSEWFRDNLVIITPRAFSRQTALRMIGEPSFTAAVTELFKTMDFDFDGFTVKTREISPESLIAMASGSEAERAEIIAGIQSPAPAVWFTEKPYRIIVKEDGKLIEKNLLVRHRRSDGNYAYISIENTSAGFRRLLDMADVLVNSESMKNVSAVIDDIDQNLHTLISRKLIEEFREGSLSGLESQLVFITHDTNLLDLNILRRDEVQFMEKDCETCSSHLTNYAEFRIIPGLNLEKGYLEGRFGAIPVMR